MNEEVTLGLFAALKTMEVVDQRRRLAHRRPIRLNRQLGLHLRHVSTEDAKQFQSTVNRVVRLRLALHRVPIDPVCRLALQRPVQSRLALLAPHGRLGPRVHVRLGFDDRGVHLRTAFRDSIAASISHPHSNDAALETHVLLHRPHDPPQLLLQHTHVHKSAGNDGNVFKMNDITSVSWRIRMDGLRGLMATFFPIPNLIFSDFRLSIVCKYVRCTQWERKSSFRANKEYFLYTYDEAKTFVCDPIDNLLKEKLFSTIFLVLSCADF